MLNLLHEVPTMRTEQPERKGMRVLAVANQKGGVGKSTFGVHIAFRAAEQGYRVLLVDVDEGDISEVFPEVEEDDETPYLKSSQLFSGELNGQNPREVYEGRSLIETDVDRKSTRLNSSHVDNSY